ncbi:phosphotransferase [Nakamurella sp. YIM 132087]|uniref:Phosphotransferase n=1 Tax=Nakamurella alba TaxID=2665158 RepID=A0A7K1FNH6_9ACTN|nr:phosphotransferase [Nakamurella alba]MTD15696.1 phosphotransferase [Nakamurella alba]
MSTPGSDLAALAGRLLPGRDVRPVEVVEVGWDHRVLRAEVDGVPWIVRAHREAGDRAIAEREHRILQLVADRLPTAVPRWELFTVVDDVAVMGYPSLPGNPLGEEPRSDGDFVLRFPPPLPELLVDRLAATLARLHDIPAAEVGTVLGPPPDPQAFRRHRAQRVDELAAAVEVPGPVLDRWRADLARDELWTGTPVLMHGDVHPGHLMVSGDGELLGIIDWTDSGWGDPAEDFLDHRHALGADECHRLLARYRSLRSTPPDDALADRTAVLQSLGPVGTALWGLETGNDHLVRRARQRMDDQAHRLAAGLDPV